MDKFISLINSVKKNTRYNPLYLAIDMNLHHLCGGNVSNKVSM